MEKAKVFIGSTVEALPIAHAIKTQMEFSNEASGHVWDGIFRAGYNTLAELLKNVEEHDFAIFLLTPDDRVSSRNIEAGGVRDNVLFEFGLFMSVLGPSRTFGIRPAGTDLHMMSDLSGITVLQYFPPDQHVQNKQDALRSAVADACFSMLENIRNFNKGKISPDVKAASSLIADSVAHLQGKSSIIENPCMRHIVLSALTSFSGEIRNIGDRFVLPASQYPSLLISLQERYESQLVVRAVAVVDQEEKFWRQDQGRKILLSSEKHNERIFTFINDASFTETWPDLQAHADKYNVKVMDYAHLSRVSVHHKDFSLMEIGDDKVVSYYDNSRPPNIVFSVNKAEINIYEKEYSRIGGSAQIVKYYDDPNMGEEGLEDLRHRVFSQSSKYDHKPVEMSRYISIDKYDQYEEKHPFRQEMIAKMLNIATQQCKKLKGSKSNNARQWRLLELGAGTGLFTKYLSEIPGAQVTALEYDFPCFNKLEEKMREHSNVLCLHQDSRSYDPGGNEGKYDFIFSCFADHHIQDVDKTHYFKNIAANLGDNGLFIVGEEFLCGYDRNDQVSRDEAIRSYHKFIIGLVQIQTDLTDVERMEISRLESDAMESGLQRHGDFKVSFEVYADYLMKAGMLCQPFKVGPTERDDVGGVYVAIGRSSQDNATSSPSKK